MPSGVPNPPERSDSLQNEITPPIPPKPSCHGSAQYRVNISSLTTVSSSARSRSPGSLKKMATLEHLNLDSTTPQDFEQKSHYKHSFRTFFEFYQNGYLCDVELIIGNKSFKCHRMVLACVSQYFKAMFQSEMAESRAPSITIHDIDETAMEKLIQFAYTSKVKISVDNVQPLLYAASILQMETVAKACCDFMKKHLHPSNCIGVHNFAEMHNRIELMKMTDDFILDNFLEIVELEEFTTTVSFKLMLVLMSSADLNIEDEVQAYETVIKWVKADITNRKVHLAELVSHLRLPLMSPAYLQKHVATEELIKKDLECRDLLDEAKYYQMASADLLSDVSISERTRPRKSYAGK